MRAATYANIDKYLTIQGIPRGPKSKYYIVDGTNGSDSNDGSSFLSPMKTVSAAEDKCVSGQHDAVIVLAATTAVNETAAITWDKNLTHLVGWGAPGMIAQRTRIVANATGLSPFITISGYGCIFRNLYIWQGQNDATSLINVSVTGNRNYFENIHFAGGGHAAQAIDGGASLYVNGGKENLFRNCTVGVDTAVADTGMANVLFDDLAARNVFDECRFLLYAGATGAVHVEVVDNAGLDRWNEFRNCLFINSCRTYTVASTFVIPASMTSVTNYILLKGCSVVGSTDWDASNRGVLYLDGGTITGGGNAGLFVVSNAT